MKTPDKHFGYSHIVSFGHVQNVFCDMFVLAFLICGEIETSEGFDAQNCRTQGAAKS